MYLMIKPLRCTLTFRLYLNKHLKTCHTEQKLFMCLACDKEFAEIASLKRHIVTHKHGKAHKCKLCNKAFKSRSGTSICCTCVLVSYVICLFCAFYQINFISITYPFLVFYFIFICSHKFELFLFSLQIFMSIMFCHLEREHPLLLVTV